MKKLITILYVEDEEMLRENTKRPLKYMCDSLFVAKDGKEGLELYKKHYPDIVISDIKMPNLNGIEMVQEIKKIKKNQHIVFTTAHSESSYFIDAIEMQVDGYILKPLDYDLLEDKIASIVHQINLEYKFEQQKVIIDEISKLQNNLLVVLDAEQNPIFANNQFLHFFSLKSIESFQSKYNSFNTIFSEESLFQNSVWIHQIQNLKDDEKIVKLFNLQTNTQEAFYISITKIEKTHHIIVTFTEITDLTQRVDTFKDKAFKDELTKIYNRAYFNEKLTQEIQKVKKDKKHLSLVFFDIDKFKNFNDTYGHQIGDMILYQLATLIGKHIRKSDILARWGGEEFILILPDSSLDAALRVAENLRIIVQNYIFQDNLQVTCSFGVAQYSQEENSDNFLKRADDALYKAKENGRNRVEKDG